MRVVIASVTTGTKLQRLIRKVLNTPPELEMPMSAVLPEPILIKQYARSRLYDPANQLYVTLPQLRERAT